MDIFIVYLLLGAVAGVLAGLLGLGGGIVIVPVLFFLFGAQDLSPAHTMHIAVGSSLATVVLTSITSSLAHHRRGAVLWRDAFAPLVPGIVVGGFLGAAVADSLPTPALRVCFGAFELIVALQLLFGLKPAPHRALPGTLGMQAAGLVIGTVSSVLGIGGGTLTVPFLLWCNVVIQQAVATSAACGLPIALAGTVGFMITGWGSAELPGISTGYVYWPAVAGVGAASIFFAPLGARLAHTLPIATLRRIFAMVLAIIGLRMLL